MLVGEIAQNTVVQLLRTLSQAHANALVLFDHEGQSGFAQFVRGDPVKVSFQSLEGADALVALQRLRSGHFALRKPSEDQPATPRGHVFLASQDSGARTKLKRWFFEDGFETSTIPFSEQLSKLVWFLKPDMVVCDCPRATLGSSCGELQQEWNGIEPTPPVLVPVRGEDCDCDLPEGTCLVAPPTRNDFDRVVSAHLEGRPPPTMMQDLASELSAPIEVGAQPGSYPSAPGAYSATYRLLARQTVRADLRNAATVLAIGSALIWLTVLFLG